ITALLEDCQKCDGIHLSQDIYGYDIMGQVGMTHLKPVSTHLIRNRDYLIMYNDYIDELYYNRFAQYNAHNHKNIVCAEVAHIHLIIGLVYTFLDDRLALIITLGITSSMMLENNKPLNIRIEEVLKHPYMR
ncbi:hypothetical protein ACJX0J_012460, partial [Zea mays]